MTSFPVAPKRPHEMTQHGQTRVDNYYWLRDKNDPETLKYLRAESDYLEEAMQHTKPLQEKLFVEMKGRMKEDDASMPEKRGEYFYYTRNEAGRQYPLFCRKHGSLEAAEEILIDQNQLAEGKPFCSVSGFQVSGDGKTLAYAVDFGGREIYSIYFKDLQSGNLLPDVIENAYGSAYEHTGIEWANDNKTLFYITLDDTQRPCKLHRHTVGTNPQEDVLIFEEKDKTFFLYLLKTRDDAYVMTHHFSTHAHEMRFVDANQPAGEWRIIQPRVSGLEYHAAHHHGKFYIVNNDGAKNFKLSVAPVENPAKENWREVLPHREDTLILDAQTFEDFLVLVERRGGLRQIRISPMQDIHAAHYVQFPEPSYIVYLESNPTFNTNLLRFKYSSMVTPGSVIDYDMATGEWILKKQTEIPSGYDKSQYTAERIFAAAPDGTQVPISLVYKKGLVKNHTAPTLLYGYGSYGASMDASFNSSIFSLLDRGFVFAIGHIRGGSEMGREWYEGGKMLNKKNTFTDFIACAEHLIREGYTSKEKLAIMGASAGGLLVGACMTMRPDLFKAVICKVPFVDVVTTMSDPSIPLTTAEYDQWGNPENKEYFDYMMSYSPYDNIRATAYPHVMITTGLNDPRVAFWEPAKFAAKLREMKTDDNMLVLYINYDSGHAGASGRYDYLKEIAQDYAFLIDRLGVK